MALPNGSGGYQFGSGNLSEVDLVIQSAPVSLTTGVTLTAAQVSNGIILGNPGASAVSYQLPTASDLDTLVSSAKPNSAFDFSVINVDGNTSGVITLTTNTGWTLVGLMTVVATAGTAQSFRARKTGDGTWTLYRIA
jgi:hypothetical protein